MSVLYIHADPNYGSHNRFIYLFSFPRNLPVLNVTVGFADTSLLAAVLRLFGLGVLYLFKNDGGRLKALIDVGGIYRYLLD